MFRRMSLSAASRTWWRSSQPSQARETPSPSSASRTWSWRPAGCRLGSPSDCCPWSGWTARARGWLAVNWLAESRRRRRGRRSRCRLHFRGVFYECESSYGYVAREIVSSPRLQRRRYRAAKNAGLGDGPFHLRPVHSVQAIMHRESRQGAPTPVLHLHPPNTYTRPAPTPVLHLHPSYTYTRPAPKPTQHLHPSCTYTRPAPTPVLHLHPSCTYTRPAPTPILHLHPPNTYTRPAPTPVLHLHPSCTYTRPTPTPVQHLNPSCT